jgi:endonuclease I
MIKKILFFISLFFSFIPYAQVVINELDADTPSTDNLEFIELKSSIPNFSLDGYVLVFFNGSTTGLSSNSYYSLDLDGQTTDVNGIIHFGSSQVSPTPRIIIQSSIIQNGPDAIGLYIGNSTDFPLNTSAHNNGLIDAIAYTNSTTVQPTTLMSILNIPVCTNENQTNLASAISIQRKNDGTFEVKTPTPGVNNDGSGIVFNYVTTTTNFTTIAEAQILTLTVSTTNPVITQPLVISFTLNNGTFNSSDFSGLTTITIPIGSNIGSASIQILDDSLTEGDEDLKIVLNPLPMEYCLNNNNLLVRVNDINFLVLPFGTPLNPTFGAVTSSAPVGYYASLEGLTGLTLKQAVNDIIANPSIIHAHNYGDIETILKISDQNPANSNQVWLMYVEQPRSKIDFQDSNSNIGKWNREHIFPQSRGGFQDGTSSFADGINTWLPTNTNDIMAGHADAHHIRAEDGPENSSRSNRDYGSDYNGPLGNLGSWKGDVARSLFYMAVRYNTLNLVNGNPADTTVNQLGDLSSLLTWNHSDPSDDFEMNRNNYIYTWQVNRNPFVDYPNLADYIWGSNTGQPWFSNLATTSFSESKFVIYPNPIEDIFTISGSFGKAKLEVYTLIGNKIYEQIIEKETSINISNYNSGIYIVKLISNEQTIEKKIVKK